MNDEDRAIIAALPKNAWRIASYAKGQRQPVLVAELPDGRTAVRRGSSKTVLIFTRDEMSAFYRGAKAGEFDDLT